MPADFGRRVAEPAGHDGRMRSFANVLDSIASRETENQRWLRNAAQWLRDNPDLSEEIEQ